MGLDPEQTLIDWAAAGALITRRAKRIVGLDLQKLGANITDETVTSLVACFPDVETLSLAQTAVTDAALETLATLKALKLLILTGSRVTREAVRAIRPRMLNTRIVLP